MFRIPKKKKLDPKDPDPCRGCSNCCEYIALEIDAPTTVRDFSNIIWYVLHKDVWVYTTDDKEWYIQFNTDCEKLENRRCTYYEHRPIMCREHKVETCVRYGEGYEEKYLFKNENDVLKFLAKKRPAIFKKLNKKTPIPYSKKEHQNMGDYSLKMQ